MASLRTSFEKELRTKLSQKTAGRLTEEGVLLKAFKYFDLDSTGTVEHPAFIKTCEKIGIHTFTKDQFEELFKFYDINGEKRIDYKQFAAIVFGNNSSTTRQMSPTKGAKWGGNLDDMEKIVEKLKKTLSSRGSGGIVGLGIQFRHADKDGNRKLEPDEFYYGMRDFGTGFSEDDCKKLFSYFDKDGDGTVDFDEFIFTIRGQLNPFRLALVNQAFDKIDKDHSGELTVDDLKGVYNAKNHPDVKAGKKTEDQVLNEFLHTFTCVYTYHEIDHDRVTRSEFTEYYAFISASVDNDQYFELMMNNAWRMNEGANKKWNDKGWSNKDEAPSKPAGGRTNETTVNRNLGFGNEKAKSSGAPRDNGTKSAANIKGSYLNNQNDDTVSQSSRGGQSTKGGIDTDALLKKIRDKLATRGTKGFIGIQRQFKIMDVDGDHSISFGEFTTAMKNFGVTLSEPEGRAVFADFDEDGDGTVSIDEFIRELRGEMNDFRKGLVMKAFSILDRDGDGVIRVNDIKGVYSAKMHPDVKAGKKTEDEVLGEFLDTFEMHHGIHAANPKDHNVTKKEFTEYYNHVSASIDNDQYFELMMINGYKLYNTNPKYKEYAPTNTGSWKSEEPKMSKPSSVAPFGTTETAHDWSTSNRPSTSQQQSRPKTPQVEANKAAGVSSWPGSNKNMQQGGKKANDGERLLKIFQDKVAARGARGIFSLGRLFRIIDDDNSRSLNKYEFQKVVKDFRMEMNEDESIALFAVFDRDGNGEIDYDEFLRTVRGPMNDNRKKFVQLAFNKLDKDGDGTITLDEVRGIYNAKNHPDVKSGKKTEDEVLAEFLDTFEVHHQLHTGDHMMKDIAVPFNEFFEYYNNISCSIDDDRYWELMMTNAWNLNNVSYQKGWRGDK